MLEVTAMEFNRIDREWAEGRRMLAAEVWSALNDVREIPYPHRRKLVDAITDRERKARYFPKPTVENLMRAAEVAQSNAEFAASRLGEMDTEYYSACGHDDFLSERAEEFHRYALDCWRSAVHLAICEEG